METPILEFVRSLRGSGIQVTTGETLDALRAAAEVPVSDRQLLRQALRSTLIKKAEQFPEFERLFRLHFFHLGEESFPGESDKGGHNGFQRLPGSEMLSQSFMASFSGLALGLMAGDETALERLAVAAARAVSLSQIQFPLQAGSYMRRMNEHLDWDRAAEELERALEELSQGALNAQELEQAREALRQNKESFQRLLRRLITREVQKAAHSVRESFVMDTLMGKSFSALSDHEIREMRRVVARLVQRLRSKMALLERTRQRGRMDIRKTLRRNLQHGGVPVELVFKVRRRRKAQVVALCDVSSSVWNASRFMLNLLYAIQDQFAQVRSFVFVSELGEVTHFFQRYEINEAIQKALKEAPIRYHSYSDYGDVLLEFHAKHLGEISTRSIVIIIGDGRNNYLPTRAWVLQELKERVRKLIWLNPEPRSMWGTGDSAMLEYAPFCTSVEECRNLLQLSDFVDRLMV
ncbi:MAG: VWA domain-containing protein [bacterium]